MHFSQIACTGKKHVLGALQNYGLILEHIINIAEIKRISIFMQFR
jgi:hypothetical protein